MEFIDPHFHVYAIFADLDDNKFVDCAFAANAAFIVSEDSHFEALKTLAFPKIMVLKLKAFLKFLENRD